ncbi:hypothetical protein LZ30DRAFT_366588 [Colletotrichum cereale]|nr:hypothetical protein LZ30DRAFT_366588 [Colletotrichum cereale]
MSVELCESGTIEAKSLGLGSGRRPVFKHSASHRVIRRTLGTNHDKRLGECPAEGRPIPSSWVSKTSCLPRPGKNYSSSASQTRVLVCITTTPGIGIGLDEWGREKDWVWSTKAIPGSRDGIRSWMLATKRFALDHRPGRCQVDRESVVPNRRLGVRGYMDRLGNDQKTAGDVGSRLNKLPSGLQARRGFRVLPRCLEPPRAFGNYCVASHVRKKQLVGQV